MPVERKAKKANQATNRTVIVSAPTRLHFGLSPVDSRLAPRYAGLGVALEEPRVVVEVRPATEVSVTGEQPERVRRIVDSVFRDVLPPTVRQGVAVHVREAPPAHVGLGSGTQLALATALGMCTLFECDFSPWTVAQKLGRARRSAIGVAAFVEGGLILDMGRVDLWEPRGPEMPRSQYEGCTENLPRVHGTQRAVKVACPKWPLVVLLFSSGQVFSEDAEEKIFAAIAPTEEDERTADQMRATAELVVDAARKHDFEAFVEQLGAYGTFAGKFFRPYQGGHFSSRHAEPIARFTKQQWSLPVLQSSWGPVVAIPARTLAHARRIRETLLEEFGDVIRNSWISSVAQRGAILTIEDVEEPS